MIGKFFSYYIHIYSILSFPLCVKFISNVTNLNPKDLVKTPLYINYYTTEAFICYTSFKKIYIISIFERIRDNSYINSRGKNKFSYEAV